MVGRSLAFLRRQDSASLAMSRAALTEYSPRSLGSMIMRKLRLSGANWATHSSSFCSPCGRWRSSVRRPVRISYSTTPKLHTSLFTVRCPVSM
ncbi:Os09g0533650 [Oryza sativa Japonica Group]|uniref:Os09g0533650 protein n=2 Tax=Oryza sativa subsp. japonica TaxID=39947 RepID=C7J6Y5_ORYSJ|nr:hypothetical protein EE612_049148 [Oryza sativa]BAH94683.1 Os09g0533650 [Oryza sativa Japonica Group]BAT09126.1 Os09g0533650 [Oryza sativa Japonica Group]|eukprot:NP_001175955.1 Os09g0533650 [Oryza sativa Japonica Group]